ncbi:MAG: NADH-quinone oxidoreductase subunit C [Polyangiaceae bacterium]
MAQRLVDLLKNQFSLAVLETQAQHGDETVVLEPGSWHEVCAFLRSSPQADMNMLSDLTAVDYPDRDPRFEVVAHLYSLSRGHRIRLKARVGDRQGEDASIESLTDLWGSANWLERECFDMFGIRFVNHPDLRRILLYPEFIGHPLRRDYPAERIQPLVPYRDGPQYDKVAPFRRDEGMPFGRQTHIVTLGGSEDPELFPESSTEPDFSKAN